MNRYGPIDDPVARARALLDLEDAQEPTAAERAYDAAHPDARQLVDWHAEYLLKKNPALGHRRALREAKAQALREEVLRPVAAANPPCPSMPRGDE